MFYFLLIGLLGSSISFEVTPDVSSLCFLDEGSYQRITLENNLTLGLDGEPSLPSIPIKIALPPGMNATNISIDSCIYENLPGRYTVFPVTPTFCGFELEPSIPAPNEDIYSNNSFYPNIALDKWESGILWGFPLASYWLRPVQWNPVTGQVRILTSAKITLELENSSFVPISERTSWSENTARDLIRKVVINPGDVVSSGASIISPEELEYGQYVIITVPEYLSPMQNLANWKTSKGVPTTVHTTNWIQSTYPHSDLQSSVRAFLTNCRDSGVDFVLITGDNDIFEARFTHPQGAENDALPSDLYYADNNDMYPGEDIWDSNRNGFWGEPEDNLDWHPDLWVGRASVNSLEEAELFVEKVFIYEHTPARYLNEQFSSDDTMLFGYTTGFLFPGYNPGSIYAENISTTVPEQWSEFKCYESEGTNSTPQTIEMINSGPDQLFHLNHGSPTAIYTKYGDFFTTDDIMALKNISESGVVSIWNSLSCNTGAFDTLTSCADAWLNAPMGGGFACLNARAVFISTAFPISYEFYRSFFEDGVSNLGIAHGLSVDYICPLNSRMDASTAQGNNLFGDPELPMWLESLGAITVEHPQEINGTGPISISITNSNGTPLKETRVCLQKGHWKTGEIYWVGYTDINGEVIVDINPLTLGEIVLTATALNHNPFQCQIPVTSVEYSQGNQLKLWFKSNPATLPVEMYFSVPGNSNINISIFDITGRVISIPASGDYSEGTYSMDLEPFSTGVYFARISDETNTLTESFTIL